jgi:hypothetical protein
MEKTSCPELNKLLDAKNKELFDFVSTRVPISVCYGTENNYGVFQRNNKAVIYIPKDNYSPDSFAHELLHVLLSTYGVNIGASIKLQKNESKHLSLVISDTLADHITNVLEHRKMFPRYIALGYDRMNFLSDASSPVLTNEEVSQLRMMFKTGRFFHQRINPAAVDFFIGKYLAAKGACIGVFDYSLLLSEMKRIEPGLCAIIDTLLSRWDLYDETKEGDIASDSYICIAYDFLNDIGEWVKHHKIA